MKATYIDHMGSDLNVVNAARVSFGKKSDWETVEVEPVYADPRSDEPVTANYFCRETGEWKATKRQLSKADQGLIAFLARGCTSGDWDSLIREVAESGLTFVRDDDDLAWDELEELLNHIRKMPSHWSPFAHTAISLHLKMPIFVARQIMKHTTGIEYNEVSRRYVTEDIEFFQPDVWRKAANNVKQGSSDEEVILSDWNLYPSNQYHIDALCYYDDLLDAGVAPEQARMVLPQSMYTEVIATGNLYAWANLVNQRTDSHAQLETQMLAREIGTICDPLFPVSWKELTK